jgi:DNA recombination protein RmuC
LAGQSNILASESIREFGAVHIRTSRKARVVRASEDDMDWTIVSFGLAAFSAALLALLWRMQSAAKPAADPSAQLEAKLDGIAKLLASGQTSLADSVNERLDAVSSRLGASLDTNRAATAESLSKLGERLAVIDAAQKGMSDLAGQVTSLQGVLANKQSRGAFGQWRMESIIEDNLPQGTYVFQAKLSNGTRPDCVILMPDKRPLVIDAKFPLEAVAAYRGAASDEERKAMAARVRGDVAKHIADIAEKYLIPGETQDSAFMFIPSEAVYAELHESFDDLVQKAYRARVFIVSPTLLMLAIQIVQHITRDARMREAADLIREEVLKLLDDVGRLGVRVRKLQTHFGQTSEDVRQAILSLEKVEARGERIKEAELAPPAVSESEPLKLVKGGK